MKKIIAVLIIFFPWKIKRLIYIKYFKYELDPTSKIGLSIIYPKMLVMKSNSSINNFTLCKNIDLLELNSNSGIGTFNWITGYPSTNSNKGHFSYDKKRFPALILGKHSGISSRHMIDCTNTISIGKYSTIAGTRSQFLTHSVNIYTSRQESLPIVIGDYCFISTNTICVSGCIIPDYSIIGALSLCNKEYKDKYSLYGGVPAIKIKSLDKKISYFTRQVGFIE